MTEKLLTRANILKVEDSVFETIDVPEWGGQVRLKGFTARQRDDFEQTAYDYETDEETGKMKAMSKANFRGRLASLMIVDQEGKRVFTDTDMEALGQKSARAMQRVFNACMKLNAMSDDDVKELTKN